jgi:single-stranded DNA-binding protein
MITISGSGNITRAPELRHTSTDKAVTTVSIACQQRNRDDGPLYVDLILWEAQAEAAVKHLVKGQSVSFTGRPVVSAYKRGNGDAGATLEVKDVDLEYGAKPRERQPEQEPAAAAA